MQSHSDAPPPPSPPSPPSCSTRHERPHTLLLSPRSDRCTPLKPLSTELNVSRFHGYRCVTTHIALRCCTNSLVHARCVFPVPVTALSQCRLPAATGGSPHCIGGAARRVEVGEGSVVGGGGEQRRRHRSAARHCAAERREGESGTTAASVSAQSKPTPSCHRYLLCRPSFDSLIAATLCWTCVLSAYQSILVSVQAEWEAGMSSMEQRECQLRVERDEWKEAVEQGKQQNDQLKAQLQVQASELEQRSAVVTEKQNEICKSAADRRVLLRLESHHRTPHSLTRCLCCCWLLCCLCQPSAAVGRSAARDDVHNRPQDE